MTTVGAYEAKTHLPRLLAEVEKGGIVTITRHGREIARLVPANRPLGAEAGDVARRIRQSRQGLAAQGQVRSMIEEGRR